MLVSVAIMLVTDGMLKGCQFVINIFIARKLGPSDYGLFNDIFSLSHLLGIAIDMGLSTAIVRDLASNDKNARKNLDGVLFLKAVLVLGCLVLGTVILLTANQGGELTLWFWLTVGTYNLVQWSYLHFIYGIWRGEKLIMEENKSKLINLFGLLLGFSLFVYTGSSNHAGLPLLLIALTPSVILSLTNFKGFFSVKIPPPYNIWLIITRAKYLYLNELLSVILLILPFQYISRIHSHQLVGYYSAAYRLVLPMCFVVAVVNKTLLTFLVSKKKYSSSEIAVGVLSLFGISVFSILIMKFSPWLIANIYGPSFSEAIVALQWLAFLPPIYGLFLLFGSYLIATENDSLAVGSGIMTVLAYGIFSFFLTETQHQPQLRVAICLILALACGVALRLIGIRTIKS